jgi:hypothetical protein
LVRLGDGELIKPVTKEKTDCFHILTDLDHIGGKVNGSITAKKHQRSEIWSLTAYEDVPTWYITIAPVDSKSPICLYFASGDEKFEVKLRCRNECLLLIANNPIASARSFHFTIQLFIKHVLGVGTDHPVLFGLVRHQLIMVQLNSKVILLYIYICWSGFRVPYHPTK